MECIITGARVCALRPKPENFKYDMGQTSHIPNCDSGGGLSTLRGHDTPVVCN